MRQRKRLWHKTACDDREASAELTGDIGEVFVLKEKMSVSGSHYIWLA